MIHKISSLVTIVTSVYLDSNRRCCKRFLLHSLYRKCLYAFSGFLAYLIFGFCQAITCICILYAMFTESISSLYEEKFT